MKRPRLDLMVEPGNSAKKECRKAERKWCRTKLDSDFLMFKAKKNHATFIIRNTMRNYYTDFIQENSNDQHKLFRSTKILFDQDTDSTYQKYCDSAVLANDIRNFFVQKIKRINFALNLMQLPVVLVHIQSQPLCAQLSLTRFQLQVMMMMHLIANKIKLEVLLLGSHAYASSG